MRLFKQFYESTGTTLFRAYVCEADSWDPIEITAYSHSDIESPSIEHAFITSVLPKLHEIASDVDIPLRTFEMFYSSDTIVVDISPGGDSFIVVSSGPLMDDDTIAKIYEQTHHPKYECKISDFVDKFQYKQDVLHGSEDEAGLGDVLDVL